MTFRVYSKLSLIVISRDTTLHNNHVAWIPTKTLEFNISLLEIIAWLGIDCLSEQYSECMDSIINWETRNYLLLSFTVSSLRYYEVDQSQVQYLLRNLIDGK